MSGAWYNEIDPKAAAWLRELIRQGLIADGDVDERSIEDIAPYEIQRYTQCHFFAGIGVWSYALRAAGWDDQRPVWTGSCPCQPYSQAGKGAGFDDERHLWPAWEHLIRECRPPVLFGEQVASKAAGAWADLVQDDLEALGYAFGAVPFPAASVGAPHIRDRLYWVADGAGDGRREERALRRRRDARDRAEGVSAGFEPSGSGCKLAYSYGRDSGPEGVQRGGEHGQQPEDGGARRLGDDDDERLEGRSLSAGGCPGERSPWTPSDFVWCRDDKWRPVEPGTFPLVDGAPARVGRLRGYGNAIVSEAAKVFIQASGLV